MKYTFFNSTKSGNKKASCSHPKFNWNKSFRKSYSPFEGLLIKETEKINYPKINLDKEVRNRLLQNQNESEAQVIIHFSVRGSSLFHHVRIWKSTFLFPKKCDTKSILLHVENITFYPEWMPVPYGRKIVFTLFFSSLPKDCEEFDLHEQIPEPGGFVVKGIKRTKDDVYYVSLN
jgi:hypothetical protein